MTWQFTLWGRPPSTNTLWKPIMTRHPKTGRDVLGMAKQDHVTEWQSDAIKVIGSARPSKWRPKGYVVIWFWLFVRSDMDADNVIKPLLDAIKYATEVDDDHFIPRCVWKTVGVDTNMQRLEVVVEEVSSPPAWWPFG